MAHEDRHEAATAIDPVCEMVVDPRTARSAEVDGKIYYFCSEGCRVKFVAEPGKYLNRVPFVLPVRRAKPAAPHDYAHHHGGEAHAHPPASPVSPPPKGGGAPTVSSGTKYTCPMHPQIVQEGAGYCPICGMALEPVVASRDDGPNPELVDFTRRLIVSAALAVPILVLSMGELVGLDFRAWLGRWFDWAQLVLASPVVLWAAWPFWQRFWSSLVNRSPNMWTLIGLGVGAAYLFSLVAVVAPQLFPMGGMGTPVYFEAAAVIVALVFVGQVLELRARESTGEAIGALRVLAPRTAHRIVDGKESVVPLE